MPLAAVPLTDPKGASGVAGVATTPTPLAAGTDGAAGAATKIWTEVFVKDGAETAQRLAVTGAGVGSASGAIRAVS